MHIVEGGGNVNNFNTFGGDKVSDLVESPKNRRLRRNESKKKDASSLSGR